jgi:type IV secretory pathway VirB10-like protein
MKDDIERSDPQPAPEESLGELTESEAESPEGRPIDRWMKSLKEHRNRNNISRFSRKASQDRIKPLFLGVVGVAVIGVIILGLFSTPMGMKRQQTVEKRTPNLGRPKDTESAATEAENPPRSVTPLLRADVRSEREPNGLVTERHLQPSLNPSAGTAALEAQALSGMRGRALLATRPMTLSEVEFSGARKRETLAEVEARIARLEARNDGKRTGEVLSRESLDKPSLIYVHSRIAPATGVSSQGREDPTESTDSLSPLSLPAGSRLLARLQSAITTAVNVPVIAMVEYNYERDGQIVLSAGSKVFGKVEQANAAGQVRVSFDELETPDGGRWKIEGIAQALDFGPLKGKVEGQKRTARFLTRAVTGVGVVAAQAVGLRGGFGGPINNSVLVRDRLATNIAQAGEQQLQQMALTTNIVVTVPANTQLYIVLQKGTRHATSTQPQAAGLAGTERPVSRPLTTAELEELRNLRQEFLRFMQLAGGKDYVANATSGQGR